MFSAFLYLFCQKVLLPLQKLLLLQMFLLLSPLLLLLKQLMLLHYSCLLLVTDIGGAAVSAGHGNSRWLSPHTGSLRLYRDIGRVLVLSTETRGPQVRWDTLRTRRPGIRADELCLLKAWLQVLFEASCSWHMTPEPSQAKEAGDQSPTPKCPGTAMNS